MGCGFKRYGRPLKQTIGEDRRCHTITPVPTSDSFLKPGDAGRSIFIMNVHPSVGLNPPGPTSAEPFAPEASYELKIDTDGDAVANISYEVRFSSFEGGEQRATLRRVEGARAVETGAGGKLSLRECRSRQVKQDM